MVRGSGTQHVEAPPRMMTPSAAGRRMCFEQGKPFIYRRDPDTVVTEWENGVIDVYAIAANQKTRHWPDGNTQCLQGHRTPAGAPVIPRLDNPMA